MIRSTSILIERIASLALAASRKLRTAATRRDVPAASEDELEAFLSKWETDHATVDAKGPQSPTDVEYVKAMFEKRKTSWHVRSGETDVVERKRNYAVSGAILKAIAGLANNKGGHILFGVKDGASVVERMSDDKFHTLDPSILSRHLLSTLVGNDVREGAIYFRYVGETRQIKPGELRQII
jgi:hypothetical protein